MPIMRVVASLQSALIKSPAERALKDSCWWVNLADSLFAFLDVLDQALTFTHLVRRQGVTLVSERVFPFLELDTDWRAHHVQDLRK